MRHSSHHVIMEGWAALLLNFLCHENLVAIMIVATVVNVAN